MERDTGRPTVDRIPSVNASREFNCGTLGELQSLRSYSPARGFGCGQGAHEEFGELTCSGGRGLVVASTTSELHVRRFEGAKVKTLAGFREETRSLLVLTTAGGFEFLGTPQKFGSDWS
jgi:hypothetical protein